MDHDWKFGPLPPARPFPWAAGSSQKSIEEEMDDQEILSIASGPPTSKDTNPKDAVGTKKPPYSTLSATVLQEVGVGMLEGARKYGRHNYRVAGVRASVYYDATMRHMGYWWEGEDIDPDSGLSHVTKAICSLFVLRDAMIQQKMIDDRPPVAPVQTHRLAMQAVVDSIFERHPTAKAAYTEHDAEPCRCLGDECCDRCQRV